MSALETINRIKNELGVLLAIFETTQNPFDYVLFRVGLMDRAMLRPAANPDSSLVLEPGHMTVTYKGRRLTFDYDARTLRFVPLALNEIFAEEPYKELDVKGAVVVDVGASIGDTAIYFLMRGAKKVYCFEPNKHRVSVAMRNVKKNHFANRVVFFNSGFDSGKLRLGPGKKVLKADCEGCEYALFDPRLSYLKYIAANFGQIVMEYHRGAAGISAALRQLGYEIKMGRKNGDVGILYAKKRG